MNMMKGSIPDPDCFVYAAVSDHWQSGGGVEQVLWDDKLDMGCSVWTCT